MSARGVAVFLLQSQTGGCLLVAAAVVGSAALHACGDAERAPPLAPSDPAAGGRQGSSDAGPSPMDAPAGEASVDADGSEAAPGADAGDGGALAVDSGPDAPFTPIPYDADIGPMDGREPSPSGCSFVPPSCRSLCGELEIADSCSTLHASVEACECSCAEQVAPDCAGELDTLLTCAEPGSGFECSLGFPTLAGCTQEARALDACAHPEPLVCDAVPSCDTYCDLVAPLGCDGASTDLASCVCRCENELTVFRSCVTELDAFVACHSTEPVTALCQDGSATIEASACDVEWSALQDCARGDGGPGNEL